MLGRVAAQLAASQEGLNSMDLVSWLVQTENIGMVFRQRLLLTMVTET
jgi:hypothetical protein